MVGTNYNYIWTGNSRARFVTPAFIGKAVGHHQGNQWIQHLHQFPGAANDAGGDQVLAAPADKLRLGEDVYQGTNLVSKAWVALSTNVMEKLAGLGLTNVWTIDIQHAAKTDQSRLE